MSRDADIPRQATARSTTGMSRLEIMLALIVIAVSLTVLLGRLGELMGYARPVRLQTAVATVRAAAAAFHARCLGAAASGVVPDCSRLVLDGVSVAGVNGWPAAAPEGIARAAALSTSGNGAFELRRGLVHGAPALFIGLGDPPCEFLYVQASSPDVFPEVDIVDASCH